MTDDSIATAAAEPQVCGRVTDLDLKPIEAAVVELLLCDGPEPTLLAMTRSDAAGRFALPRPVAGREWLSLRADAAGYTATSIGKIDPEREVQVKLGRNALLYGFVLASGTLRPLVGARLHCREGVADSGMDGSYELPCPAHGRPFGITANCAGFLEEWSGTLQVNEPGRIRYDITLQPGTPLVVQVIDRQTRAPIAGAELRHYQTGPSLGVTDADGRCTHPVAVGREVRLVVSAPGYCGLSWKWQVDAVPEEAVILALQPPATLAGRAGDEAGIALPGVRVQFRDDGNRMGAYTVVDPGSLGMRGSAIDQPPQPTARTGADGRFALAVVPAASPVYAVGRLDDHVDARSEQVRLSEPYARADVDLVLRRGAAVFGKLLRNGKPVRGEVLARHLGGDYRQRRAASERNGTYEIGELPAGELELWVEGTVGAAAAGKARVQLAAGERLRHDIAWTAEVGCLAGKVTTSGGEPLGGIMVDAMCSGCPPFTTRTRDDGSFEFAVEPKQTYWITASRGATRADQYSVQPDRDDLALELPVLGHLRLRLVDAATRRPVGRQQIGGLGWRIPGDEAFQWLHEHSDITGMVDLELPLGSVDIALAMLDDGYRPHRRCGLPVVDAPAPPPVEIALERGVDLRIEMVGEPPFADARRDHLLFLLEDSQQILVRGPFPQEGGPSNIRIGGICMWLAEPGLLRQMLPHLVDGAAVMHGLAPGTYSLRAWPDDFVFTPRSVLVGERGGSVQLLWRPK